MKSEFYYTSSLRGRRSKGKGKGISLPRRLPYQQSVLHFCPGSWKKEKGSRKAAPVQFTVVGVQKIYQGDTVSYIMTEMLVRCWKRAKRRERIAKLAGKCSFRHAEKKLGTSSGTRVARCKLQRALYSPPLQEEVSLRQGFCFPPEVVRVADGWHSRRLTCLRTTRMPATRTASHMLRTKQETNLC